MNNPKMFEPFPASAVTTDGMKVIKPERAKTCALLANIEYIERSGKKLHLNIIRPMSFPPEKLPLIVYVQGSAWHKQNVYMNIPQLSRFAARGFVVAMVEYRESDIAPFPAQMQDCKTAVRFLRANAEQYGIDTENVTLWGDSSGGHTVLMAGITGDSAPDTADFGEYSCKVNSVVNFYGPVDVARMNDEPSAQNHSEPDSPEGFMLGRVDVLENPEKVKAANPSTYLSADKPCPPILSMHGDRDRLVPFGQSVIIHEALVGAGKQSEFYKLKDADHGSGEFWTDETFDIVEEFIRRFNSK